MRITAQYSHLNGWEFLKVHKPELWQEIEQVIALADAEKHKTKESKEKTKKGKILYAPIGLNKEMEMLFRERGWKESRAYYWVTDDAQLIRKTIYLEPEEQKAKIEAAGKTPLPSYNQTDFVKNRVAVEVQLGKYFAANYDLFVKYLAFFVRDTIDVGVEIVPARELHHQMSTGVPWYETVLYNVLRQGRGVPAVPLVLLGVAP